MKYLKFLMVGILFGIVMSKSEIISWYRIYEMFRFESFHMYGIIGSTVVLGVLMIQWMKRKNISDIKGDDIQFKPKDMSIPRYLIGGAIFGMGWALSGACPGPMLVLAGHGYASILIVISGAILGTFVYGVIRDKLPH